MHALSRLTPDVRQYLLVTGNYWAFTLTDGALRMLVVLHFHSLGYTPLQIAALFLFYEIFGVVTNLLGGYLGARIGLTGLAASTEHRIGLAAGVAQQGLGHQRTGRVGDTEEQDSQGTRHGGGLTTTNMVCRIYLTKHIL